MKSKILSLMVFSAICMLPGPVRAAASEGKSEASTGERNGTGKNSPDSLGKARTGSDIYELEDKVVTASRTRRKVQEVPRAVNFVGGRLLGERVPRNTGEALREETGLQIQKTEHGGGSAIIRGMGSSQVLLLVDGIRLNNSTYRFGNHPYLNTVDNHMLDRVEVVRGPGSTLFGSDAMGGTVNMITKAPSLGESTLSAHGRISARYATADEEKIGRAEGTLQGKGFGLVAGASLKDAGDLQRGGSTDQPGLERGPITQGPSGYSGQDYDAKLVFAPSAGHKFTLAWQSTKRPEIPRFDRYQNDGFESWLYTDQKRDLGYLIYETPDATIPLRFFTSLQRQEEGRDFQRNPTATRTTEWVEVHTYGVGSQANYQWNNHGLALGVDAYLDQVASNRFNINPATGARTPQVLALYPDGAYYGSYGAFLQDEVRLGQDWMVTAGARYSLVRMDFTFPYDPVLALNFGNVRNDFQALTGSLGLTYQVLGGVCLNANIAQGFRAPNLSDVSKNGESRNTPAGRTYEIPNSDLDPEHLLSTEIGAKVDLSRFKSGLSVYRAGIENLLGTAPATLQGSGTLQRGTQTYNLISKQNLGEAYIWGVEADASALTYAKLWLHGNITYTYGRNETRDEPVGGIPPLFGLLGLKWSDDAYGVDAYMRGATHQKRLSADDKADLRIPPGGSPGWYTFNLRGEWRAAKGLILHAGVENIMDYNYREHGSGINAPGRNLIAALEWAP